VATVDIVFIFYCDS